MAKTMRVGEVADADSIYSPAKAACCALEELAWHTYMCLQGGKVPDLRLSHQPTCVFVTLANHEQAGASPHGATKLRMRIRLLSSELNG